MKTALITTTVNIPKVLTLYARLDSEVDIVIAADKKTPPGAEEWVYEHCQPKSRVAFLTVEMQQDMEFKSSELIGWDTDSRRNIALLYAVKSGANLIVSVDDDMIPCGEDFFYNIERVLTAPYCGLQCGEPGNWFDAGQYTVPPAKQRGLPVDVEFVNAFSAVAGVEVGAMQGIILGVPDADSLTAITNRPTILSVTDVLRNGFVAHPEALAVMNSQVTAFRCELAPAFAQFYKWQGRNTDIFASLIMRRVMLELDLHTFFGPPVAFHARQPRPLLNDLRAEMYGLTHIAGLAEYLTRAPLQENRTVTEWCRDLVSGLSLFKDASEAMLAFYEDCESL